MQWGTQRAIAAQIVDAEADFILALKKNQEGLYKEVTECINQRMQTNFEGVGARGSIPRKRSTARRNTEPLCSIACAKKPNGI